MKNNKVLKEDNIGNMVEVDDLMSFIMTSTLESQLCADSTERLRKLFQESLGKDKQEINLQEIIPSKNEFFTTRIFRIFYQVGSGHISY